MDYILILQNLHTSWYGQTDYVIHVADKGWMQDVTREKGLRYLRVNTTVERKPEDIPLWDHETVDIYEDYVVEVPHEVTEEVFLFLKEKMEVFSVFLVDVHEATADWPTVARMYHRNRENAT